MAAQHLGQVLGPLPEFAWRYTTALAVRHVAKYMLA